jgi:fibronectin type 3 domain-containing protein
MVYAFDISLTWDPNNEPTVDGYKLYYGTSSKNYSESIDIGNNTKYTIKNLKRGQTYFIAVTAYDIEGNESGFSDEISYRDHQNSMPWIDVLLFNDSP